MGEHPAILPAACSGIGVPTPRNGDENRRPPSEGPKTEKSGEPGTLRRGTNLRGLASRVTFGSCGAIREVVPAHLPACGSVTPRLQLVSPDAPGGAGGTPPRLKPRARGNGKGGTPPADETLARITDPRAREVYRKKLELGIDRETFTMPAGVR